VAGTDAGAGTGAGAASVAVTAVLAAGSETGADGAAGAGSAAGGCDPRQAGPPLEIEPKPWARTEVAPTMSDAASAALARQRFFMRGGL